MLNKLKHKNMNIIIYIQSYAEDSIEELLVKNESDTFYHLIEFTKQIEVISNFHANKITSTQHTITIEPICPYNIKSLVHTEKIMLIKRIE